MTPQIQTSVSLLVDFLKRSERGMAPDVGREEVVAHATLSALLHHWPSMADASLEPLLRATDRIKSIERSRWIVQRRIAIAKLQAAIVESGA